ncbi:unnamed protein product, partial [Rotaria sp. Silwood1]
TSSKYKWYCLLPESIGRHKCMALNVDTSSSLHSKKIATLKKPHSSQNYNQSNGLVFKVDIYDRDEIQFSSGFPCKISEIKSNISSTSTRPMPGDILLQVNDINVSRTQAKAVKKLIKSLSIPITLQLYRLIIPSTSIKVDKIVLNSVEQHEPLNRNLISTNSLYLSSDKQCKTKTYDCFISKPTVMNIDHQQSLLMSPIDRKITTQSDGSESGVGSESNPYSDGDQDNRLKILSESYEREVLNLIEIEKEFINQIELGVQLYSRPLKHYLISSNEHAKLFQNIEKVIT